MLMFIFQDTNFGDENQNIDAATNKEYNMVSL